MTNVLITGASGMIGKYLVDMCLEKGYYVRGTDIRYDDRYDTYSENFEFYQADLRDFDDCKNVVVDMNVVFHVAGVKGSPKRAMEQPNDYFTPMLQFNTNMAEASRLQGVDWYVYTSSVGVYSPADYFFEDDVWKTFPSQNDKYAGWVKRLGELQLECFEKHYGLKNYSIVRPANVYGRYDDFSENGMVIPQLIKRIHNENPLICWGDGTPIRDFIHAEDVARGILMSYEKKITEPINLGSGTGVSIKELVETLSLIYQEKHSTNVEVLWDTTKPNGDEIRLMDMTRANSYGFYPKITLSEGISDVIDYIGEKNEQ